MRAARVILTVGARKDARDAVDWYARQNPRAAERFQAELRGVIELVQEAPERWPLWHPPWYRRLPFDRFPYSLIYRLHGDDSVLVVAVRHQQRDPDVGLSE